MVREDSGKFPSADSVDKETLIDLTSGDKCALRNYVSVASGGVTISALANDSQPSEGHSPCRGADTHLSVPAALSSTHTLHN